MSESKLIMKLAVSQAFTVGVLATLILTGSIQTHFDDTASSPSPSIDHAQNTGLRRADNPQPATQLYPTISTNETSTSASNHEQSANSMQLVELLKNNIEDLKVVPDGASNEEARQLLFDEFSAGPTITQGQGKKNVYILFDPLCPHCHELFKSFNSGLLKEHDLTAHWIPAVAFLENPKSMEYSQKLISSVLAGKEDVGLHALSRMMISGDFSALEGDDLGVSTTGILRVARNTVGLLQAGTGTPTLIYENTAGAIEIIEGTPSKADLLEIN